MENKNKLNEVSLARVDDRELSDIKELESRLGDKYYLIAFDKKNS